MTMLMLEGYLCMAGDGNECSYLLLNGEFLVHLLEPHGTRVPNIKVDRLPGANVRANYLANHLQRDYGKVRIVVDFLDRASG